MTAQIRQEPSPPPAILVQLPGDTSSVPIQVSHLTIEVQVVGMIATTTMDLTFYNPYDRILEGQLYVLLGAGQQMSRFALEVEGKMREGVVVEKAKGRQVFENIVRQSIDPGLLEWSKGNVFKARIFPIPANGSKRILIAYEQELQYREEGLQYLLPMNFREEVAQFDLRIEVIRQALSPVPSENQLDNLSFEEWKDAWVAEKHLTSFLPNRQIGIMIPHSPDQQRIYVEQTAANEASFYLNIPVKKFNKVKEKPQNICLLWDLSNSAENRDLEQEFDILDAYMKWVGKAQVQVIGFHIEPVDLGNFKVIGGNWTKLKQVLQDQSFDGATQLGKLDLQAYVCDEFLMFSDGLSTFGNSDIQLGTAPVYVINSAQEFDLSYLQYIAEVSGGQVINSLTLPVAECIERLQTVAYQFLSAKLLKGSAADMFPTLPEVIGETFSLAGKLVSDEAEIELAFGFGKEVVHREWILVSKIDHMGGGGKVERIWAQKKLTELDRRHEIFAHEIKRMGKEHGIVTRYTSLIVLDRVEDYVDNEILPPAELREEYDAIVKRRNGQKQVQLMSHMDQVAEAFFLRKTWWSTTFEIPEEKFEPDPVKKSMEAEADESSVSAEEESPAGLFDLREMNEELADDSDEFKAPKDKGESVAGSITLKAWDPQTPYLEAIKKAPADQQYATYLNIKDDYLRSPAFFLDVADYFRQQGDSARVLRILSNIAELELENHELLRILGHRLLQLGQVDLSILVFAEVLEMREEEPQSYRDVGLAYARKGEIQKAIEWLYKVVEGTWDSRFGEIGVIAAHEINSLVGTCGCEDELDLSFMDDRLLGQMPTDIRVVLNWDSDNVDMDLWVTDPRGEKCYYQHKRTAIGGYISDDLTRGYGPEEFWLKKAMPGTYIIEVNYYGSSRQRISGPTTIQAELILDYGRQEQSRKEITLRLGAESQVIEVGEFDIE